MAEKLKLNDIPSLKIGELRTILTSFGISAAGNKQTLADRLKMFLETEREMKEQEATEKRNSKKRPRKSGENSEIPGPGSERELKEQEAVEKQKSKRRKTKIDENSEIPDSQIPDPEISASGSERKLKEQEVVEKKKTNKRKKKSEENSGIKDPEIPESGSESNLLRDMKIFPIFDRPTDPLNYYHVSEFSVAGRSFMTPMHFLYYDLFKALNLLENFTGNMQTIEFVEKKAKQFLLSCVRRKLVNDAKIDEWFENHWDRCMETAYRAKLEQVKINSIMDPLYFMNKTMNFFF